MRGYNHGSRKAREGAFWLFYEVVKKKKNTVSYSKDPIMLDKDEY